MSSNTCNLFYLHSVYTIDIPTDNDEDLFRLQIKSVTDVDDVHQHLVFSSWNDEDKTTLTTSLPTNINSCQNNSYTISDFSQVVQLFNREGWTTTVILLGPFGLETPPLSDAEMATAGIAQQICKLVSPLKLQEKTLTTSSSIHNQSQMQFMNRVQSASQHVRMYEDKDLQRYAISKMPLKDLYEKAATDSRNNSNNPKVQFGDHLVRHFGRWFRNIFFAWMNGLACSACGNTTTCIGQTSPNQEERHWMAGTVEIYKCNTCNTQTRFPRYNHPRKLLDSRKGRCGEFANCFTLCLRSLKFDVRHVTDWTDHVWTEFYSNTTKRWIHFDSCENAFDSPLMYSNGWGKKLSYVIGCSAKDVVDVSARYVSDYKDMLTRRTNVSEQCLFNIVDLFDYHNRMWYVQQYKTTPKDWMNESIRRMQEREELDNRINGSKKTEDDTSTTSSSGETKTNVPTEELSEAERTGRTTGSVAWRAARGELGHGDARVRALQQPDVKCTTEPVENTTSDNKTSTTSTSTSSSRRDGSSSDSSSSSSCSSSCNDNDTTKQNKK